MGRISNAGILLIIVNLGFIAAGVFLIKFTSDLKATGWLEALNEEQYQVAAAALITAVLALGASAILLGVIGIIGALIRNRMLLFIYSLLMIAAMIIFGVIGGTAFSFRSSMSEWLANEYPYKGSSESTFGPKFNEIYCYAQGAFFCNTANTTDLVNIFMPGVPAEVASLLPQVKGLNSLCASSSISLVPNSDTVCKACDIAKNFEKFEKVLAWANDKCPRDAATSIWCATFLQGSTSAETYANSPYSVCRTPFLTVAVEWGTSLMTMGGVAFVVAALLLMLSCLARRSRETKHDDEEDMVIMDNHHHYKA